MPETDLNKKRQQLEQAIAAQESLRGTLDDAILDATIEALKRQLEELAPKAAPQQQRKLMTVLFMDVVHSTRLLRELDPEENMAIMDTALTRLAEPVKGQGGQVLRFMGDGFLAAFGLQQARENDPEMAVRAALEIQQTSDLIAQELYENYAITGFQVRVGINTGLVVAGGLSEGDSTIMGPAVNLAARLEQSAPPGAVLISRFTHQHVRNLFVVEPGESIQAKGFPEPVPVFLVLKAVQRGFDLSARGFADLQTELIGRDREFNHLKSAYQKVFSDKKSRFITVVGEAGLGKSRLLQEFENWMATEENSQILFKGRAVLETQDIPFGLLRNVIETDIGILDSDSSQEVCEKLVRGFESVFGPDGKFERKAHIVGQWLGYDFQSSPFLKSLLENPREIRELASVFLVEFFKKQSLNAVLVIFLDDIHWADPGSLKLFSDLSNELAEYQVFFVALTRPEFFEKHSGWGEMLAGYSRLNLEPLSSEESQYLIESALRNVDNLPASLKLILSKNADGVPFYLEELINMMIEDGVILRDEPNWRVNMERLDEIQIPDTLIGVVQARIESLPDHERKVLQQASVIGRNFWFETICFLNQQDRSISNFVSFDSAEVQRYLEFLESRELISQQRKSSFSETLEFLFKHAILREVTYKNVLLKHRRIYHSLAANWLIEHSGERQNEIAGLIANHLEKAGRKEEAVKYLFKAAETAGSKYAVEEAIQFYSRALSLTSDNDLEMRYALFSGRGNMYGELGNRTFQKQDLEARFGIAEILDDDHKRVQTATDEGWLEYYIGNYEQGKEATLRALRLAEQSRLEIQVAARARSVLIWILIQQRDFETALIEAQKALEISSIDQDKSFESSVLTALSSVQYTLGLYADARDTLLRILEDKDIGDAGKSDANLFLNLSVPLILLGDYESARSYLQKGIEINQELMYRYGEILGKINFGWTCAILGDWDQGIQLLDEAIAFLRQAEHVEALAEALLWQGHCYFGKGDAEQAFDNYQESLKIRKLLNQKDLEMGVRAALSRAELTQGNLEQAVEHVETMLSFLDAGGSLEAVWEPLRLYLSCIQVLEAAEDKREPLVLEKAFVLLSKYASRMSAEKDRRMYLENVPWHREISERWARKSGANSE